jgi:hypothetical protein
MSDESGALVRDGRFICPICSYDAYCSIPALRPLYRCGGCQVVFYNPLTFSAGKESERIRPRPLGQRE